MKKISYVFSMMTIFAFLGTSSVLAAPSDDFIITVKTDEYGTTPDTQFKIPTFSGEAYNYNVDCDNDGTDEVTGATGDYTCNYSSPGIYSIRIKDNTGSKNGFPMIYFNDSGDKLKLVGINQWGTMHWSSMANAFIGCANLNDTGTGSLGAATDAPDLSNVTDLGFMFSEASLFNQPINSWDVSSVKNMSGMFDAATSFNQPLDKWDTSNVTHVMGMFIYASSFNQDISSWNTSNIEDMNSMFLGATSFNQPLNSWDTSNVNIMSWMFEGATSFNQPLNSWDVSNVITMNGMFRSAGSFNQPLNSWNTMNVDDMSHMFEGAVSFDQNIGSWDISSVKEWDFDGKKDGGLNDMFKNAHLSVENYDALLKGWSSQVTSSLHFNAGNSKYCAVEAHDNLTSPTGHNWTITDGGQTSVCYSVTPIFRLYNKRTGTQLYTRGVADKDKILNKFKDFEFTDGAPAFYASLTEQPGLTPIFRLYNKRTGAQLYTRGVADKDKILNKFKDFEFTDGAPAFYASLTDDGTTPIYRLYNTRTGMQLYTRGKTDKDKILDKFKDFEFTDDGPAFYASLTD